MATDRPRNASPAMRRSLEERALFEALMPNNISGTIEGINPAPAGTSIYSQLYSPEFREFTQADPSGGPSQYGFTTPFTAPNGQTYYAGSDFTPDVALSQAAAYGSEPLWLDANGNPTYSFRDDNGQWMTRFPGWGEDALHDPRWGEYVPYDKYQEWAWQQGQDDFIDKYGVLLAGAGLGAVAAPAFAAGPLAEGAAAGATGVGAGGTVAGGAGEFALGHGLTGTLGLQVPATLGGTASGIGLSAVPGALTNALLTPALTGAATGIGTAGLAGLTAEQIAAAAAASGISAPALTSLLSGIAETGGPLATQAATTGAGTAASGLGAGSALSKLLSGAGSISDLTSLLGTLGATGLGYAGAKDQIDAMKEAQDKQLAMNRETRDLFLGLGAPYRDRLNASYQPGFDLFSDGSAERGALDQSYNSLLRRLSTSGNPFENPGGLTEAMKTVTQNVALPALTNYRSQLGTFGQLGTGTAGQASLNSANSVQPVSNSGVYDALGYGLSQLTNPQSDPMAMFKQMQQMALKGWGT